MTPHPILPPPPTQHDPHPIFTSTLTQHDPPVDPPEAGGVYLMDAFPLDGSQPNNDQFSPRSRAEMLGAIRDRGQSLSEWGGQWPWKH